MAKQSVEVEGQARLVATLRAASVQVADQSAPNGRAAALVATRGRAGAPVRTGRLAASLTTTSSPDEGTAQSGLEYAARTHWGFRRYAQAPQPFLADAADAAQPTWSGLVLANVQRALATVKGA